MKRIFSLLLSVILLAACVLTAGAAVEGGSVSYTSREVTAYLYGMDDSLTLKCLFRSDLPTVPYISAVDYLNQLYIVPFSCEQNSDGTYSVSDCNGEMIVDVDRDTVTIELFEELVDLDVRPILEDETAYYLKEEVEYEVLIEGKTVELDLASYGIDLVASDGQVYFPISTINDIFAGTYHAAAYLDGTIYFSDVMEEEAYYDTSALFEDMTVDDALTRFNYNELCFAMDHFYGAPSRAKLAKAIRADGLDKTLESYDRYTAEIKSLLLSGNKLDYMYGVLLLDEYLYDGGHTMMSYGMQLGLEDYPDSALIQAFYDSLYDYDNTRIGRILDHINKLVAEENNEKKLEKEREQAFAAMEKVKEWDDAALYRSGGVAVFSFDSFEDAMVEPFKWSLDYAVQNGIGNFVIDLSLNAGGSTAVIYYILSVVCDNPLVNYAGALTQSKYYLVATVDKNLDGRFDRKDDEIKYDLSFSVLTSGATFSAANAAACLLQDNGIPVAGETSGGGSCAMALHYHAIGYAYAMSDPLTLIHSDGTDLDGGAQPDIEMPGKSASYLGFYDFQAIADGAREFYEKRQEPTVPGSETETQPVIRPVVIAEDSVIGWIVPLAPAVLYAVVFVIVLLTSSLRKKEL